MRHSIWIALKRRLFCGSFVGLVFGFERLGDEFSIGCLQQYLDTPSASRVASGIRGVRVPRLLE